MKLLIPFVVLLSLGFSMTLAQAAWLQDDFSDPRLASRQALRGEWKFEEGVASCVADPELYKAFANHGPILRWPCEFTDGTVEFEFKPQGCQRVVFTLNEDGHVFRISLADQDRSSIFGWIGRSSKENKSQPIANKGVPGIEELDGQWVKVKLVIQGDEGTIQLANYSAKLKHGSLARKKGEFTISFASGECAIRQVSIK